MGTFKTVGTSRPKHHGKAGAIIGDGAEMEQRYGLNRFYGGVHVIYTHAHTDKVGLPTTCGEKRKEMENSNLS